MNNFTVVCVESDLLGFGSINTIYQVKTKPMSDTFGCT